MDIEDRRTYMITMITRPEWWAIIPHPCILPINTQHSSFTKHTIPWRRECWQYHSSSLTSDHLDQSQHSCHNQRVINRAQSMSRVAVLLSCLPQTYSKLTNCSFHFVNPLSQCFYLLLMLTGHPPDQWAPIVPKSARSKGDLCCHSNKIKLYLGGVWRDCWSKKAAQSCNNGSALVLHWTLSGWLQLQISPIDSTSTLHADTQFGVFESHLLNTSSWRYGALAGSPFLPFTNRFRAFAT